MTIAPVKCKCGSDMVVFYERYIDDRWAANCLNCNRTVDYFGPHIFQWKADYVWSHPVDFLKCKCGNEFFCQKILSSYPVKFYQCNKCGQEMDLRK